MELTDEEREAKIAEHSEALLHASSSSEKRLYWNKVRELIQGRSPEMVRKLEIEHGLLNEKKEAKAA